MKISIASLQKIINEMAFPEGIKCIVCDDELTEVNRFLICRKCILPRNEYYCVHCGRAFESFELIASPKDSEFNENNQTVIKAPRLCENCNKYHHFFDYAKAPFIYEKEIKGIIHRFKYGNERYLSKYLAEHMADTFNKTDWKPDIVTFVPMTLKREKKRGYNQAQLLSVDFAKLLGLELSDLLIRIKQIEDVARMTRKQRAEAIKGSIKANVEYIDEKIKNKKILLIDDVLTTGATAGECSRIMKQAGAGTVYVLTFATAKA